MTEVKLRQAQDGDNRLPKPRHSGLLLFIRQFRNPFIYLLIFAAAVAVIVGEGIDALTILVVLLVGGFLGFIQEHRAERAIGKLESLLTPQTKVWREGQLVRLSVYELVRGDLVIIEAGDIAPADLRLIETQNLVVDESVLTGESEDRPKDAIPFDRVIEELYQAANIIFSGTRVRVGRGLGLVVATGQETVLGRIAHRLGQIERKSGFEEYLTNFSRVMMKIVVVTIFVLIISHLFLDGENNLVSIVLFALALAVSVVPEALPVVTTVALANGATHLARRERVIVRRLSALEDLGSLDVLCVDKTGTITENKLVVSEIKAQDQKKFLATILTEARWLTARTPGGASGLNAFDQALLLVEKKSNPISSSGSKIIWDQPFDSGHRFSAVVEEKEGKRRLIVRGALEEVLRCSDVDDQEREYFEKSARLEGEEGKRIFSLATRQLISNEILNQEIVKDLFFEGYVSFVDPLKPTAVSALDQAKELGVEVRILTGDSPAVAAAVAREVGLVREKEEVITGERLRALGINEREEVIKKTKVFARVSPEEKFLIIQTLQKDHRVGFLGEGVNDALALELANVALVVDRAADVARESADAVLLEHDLRAIIGAIAHGRRIFENVQKYIKYTMIGNFGNFFALAGVSFFLPFLPLLPVQILLTNLLTDLPLMAVSVDRVGVRDIRWPRQFLIRPLIFASLILGLTSAFFDFLFFGIFWQTPAPLFRTLWFVFSVLTELLMIFSLRLRGPLWQGPRPGLLLVFSALGAGLLTMALPYLGSISRLFYFVSPSVQYLGLTILLALSGLLGLEIVKLKVEAKLQPVSMKIG